MITLQEAKKLQKFSFDEIKSIPNSKGIYFTWKKSDNYQDLIYVGKSTKLFSRIKSHYSGQRGSDQFCLYIFDSYMKLQANGIGADISKDFNQQTQQFSRDELKFSFIVLKDNENESEVESFLRNSLEPTLNPLKI
jgi:hypothetical protein